ncbi:MAG: PLP-dependent aminotransferase family protein [Clostridia bacterium]|nr:PLP-dependent aminotransferase family protein [Clostridia bacterium]
MNSFIRRSGQIFSPARCRAAENCPQSAAWQETAYAQLLAEGYISARERSGYFVESIVPTAAVRQELPSFTEIPPSIRRETPSAQLFPFTVWAKLMRSVLLDEGQAVLGRVPPNGLPELRQAICRELLQSRGIRAVPQAIVVGAGAEYLYNLLIQFLGKDRRYCLEDPGHRKLARVYEANGVRFSSIGLDADGILPDRLQESGAEILHISPSHHFPTGIVTGIARRQQLMAWLRQDESRIIIEDDYDAEFRFSGLPIPTMQSMDDSGRVIYMNTFSRTIAPALRISYMVLPRQMIGPWQEKMGFYSCTVPSFEQLTLTRFLEDGYFDRHLSRMKKHYRALRARILGFLAQEPYCRICRAEHAEAGLHFILRFFTAETDAELESRLRECGLELPLLADFYVGEASDAAKGCVLLQYADMDPEQFEKAMRRFCGWADG